MQLVSIASDRERSSGNVVSSEVFELVGAGRQIIEWKSQGTAATYAPAVVGGTAGAAHGALGGTGYG